MNALYYASIINTVLRYTSPVLLATLASLLCSRAGVFNIALEGQMLLGSFFAIAVNYYTHSVVLSVLAGVAAGALVGLLVAVFQIRLGAKDMVVGTSVNILAVALSAYLLYAFFGVRGALADSSLVAMSKINLSFLPADFFLFRVFANLTFIDYGCYLIAVLLYIYMYKTIGGFHLRSVGINKAATESLGTKADRTQVCAMIVSGALCGLGGVALCMGGVTMFAENMTNGRGYVAMAAIHSGGGSSSAGYFGLSVFRRRAGNVRCAAEHHQQQYHVYLPLSGDHHLYFHHRAYPAVSPEEPEV